MDYNTEDLFIDTYITGSNISLLDIVVSSIQYIAKRDCWNLLKSNIFGVKCKRDDEDEDGETIFMYSRFGQSMGYSTYEYKKVSRGEPTWISICLDVPLLRIEHRGEFIKEEDLDRDCDVKSWRRIRDIVSGDFLTMRGLITLAGVMFSVPVESTSLDELDDYVPGNDSVLDNIVEQSPIQETRNESNPKNECRRLPPTKAPEMVGC